MDALEIEFAFSQPDSECFLVKDSQEETQELSDPVKMLEKLPALRRIASQNETRKEATRSSPRKKCQLPVRSSPRKTAGLMSISQTLRSQIRRRDNGNGNDTNGSGDDVPENPDVGEPQGGGGNQGGGGGEGAPNAGGGGGAAGGGGGDDGNGNNHGEDLPEDQDSDEDNHQEEDQPSSSDSGSVPSLIPAPSTSSQFTPPRHIPGHYESHPTSPRPSTSAMTVGEDTHRRDDSESEGGISNASTAVVSDTEGHGQIIQPRVRRGLGNSPARSPGHARSPRTATDPRDTSSAMSTLSSYTSSSASEDQTSPKAKGTPKKRTASKRLPMPPSKRVRLDTSSSTTSTETKTTSSSSTKTHTATDTSTDTSGSGDKLAAGDRSVDTTADKSHDMSEDIGSSQQDMFCDDPGTSKEEKEKDCDLPTSTPSALLESLNFSGHHSTPTPSDQIQSLGYVPASQDTYSSSIPFIFPGSPTADVLEDESVPDSFRAELGGITKLTKKSSFEIREERRQMPPPSFETPVIPELPSTAESEAAGDGIEAQSSTTSADDPFKYMEAQPLPSLSIPETDTSNGSSSSSDKSKNGDEKTGGKIVDRQPVSSQSKAESEAWNLEFQATEQTCMDESERPQGSMCEVSKTEEPKKCYVRTREPKLQKSQEIQKPNPAESSNDMPSLIYRSQPETKMSQSEEREPMSWRNNGSNKALDLSVKSSVSRESSQKVGDSRPEQSHVTDQTTPHKSGSQNTATVIPRNLVFQSQPYSQQSQTTPIAKSGSQKVISQVSVARDVSLEECSDVDDPEHPRQTQGNAEEEEEQLALHLSQTQNTQSQYSVGVGAILNQLDKMEDASQPITTDVSPSPRPSQTRCADSLAEVSLPLPPGSQIGGVGIPEMNLNPQLSTYQSDNGKHSQSKESSQMDDFDEDLTSQGQNESSKPPPLSLDMVETQDDDTQGSVSIFSLNRPNFRRSQCESEDQPMDQSVFSRVKKSREKRVVNLDVESEDPFAFTSQSQSTERVNLPSSASRSKSSKKKVGTPVTPGSEGYHSFCPGNTAVSATDHHTEDPASTDDVILLSEVQVDNGTQDQKGGNEFTHLRSDKAAAEVIEINSQSSQENAAVDTCTHTSVMYSHVETERGTVDTPSSQDLTAPLRTSSQKEKSVKKASQKKGSQRTASQGSKVRSGPVKVLVEETPSGSNQEVNSAHDSDIIPQTDSQQLVKSKTAGRVRAPPVTPGNQSQPDTMEIDESGTVSTAEKPVSINRPSEIKTPHRRKVHRRFKSGKKKKKVEQPMDLDVPAVPILRPQDTLKEAGKGSTGVGSNTATPTGRREIVPSHPQQPTDSTSGHQPDTGDTSTGRNPGIGDGPPSGGQAAYSRVHRIETVIRVITDIQEDFVNGRIVNHRVIRQRNETISSHVGSLEDSLSTPSPSRKTQSLTSGDLADISSLSRSTSNKTGTGSTFSSPHATHGSSTSSTSHSGGGVPSHSSQTTAHTCPPTLTSSARLDRSVQVPSLTGVGKSAGPESSVSLFSARAGSSVEDKSPVSSLPPVTSGQAIHESDRVTPSGEQTMIKTSDTSSSSYIKPADLDTSIEKLLPKRKSSSTTVSSVHSVLLFSSTTSPEGISYLEDTDISREKIEFQKPNPPGALKRPTISTVKGDLSKIQEESPRGVATDEIKSTPKNRFDGKGKIGKGKGRGKGIRAERESLNISEVQSPMPPTTPSTAPTQQLHESGIVEGTPVFAMWRDKFYYHGKTTGFESQMKCGVNFDDGMSMKVTKSHVIASSWLAVGHKVMADEGGYSVLAVVIGLHEADGKREYEVKHEDGTIRRVSIEMLSLDSEQFEALKSFSSGSMIKTDTTAPITEDSARCFDDPVKDLKEKKETYSRDKAVYGMYKDKFFYPGYLVAEEEGKYTVAFEDGDICQVRGLDVIHCDLLPLGQDVFAMGEDGAYARAIIIEVFDGTQKDWGYKVEFVEGGHQKRVGREKVILNNEQGCTLRQDKVYMDVSPKMADVSLNNLVDGKRRRGTPNVLLTQSPKTPKSSAPGVRSQKKRAWTTGGKGAAKKKFSSVEPTATSTPTPKRFKTVLKTHIHDGDAPSPLTYESPKEKRASPKKFRQELFTQVKGPVPRIGSTLFRGKCFFLTYVDTIAGPTTSPEFKPTVNTESDESSIEGLKEMEEVPFDKDHIKKQIVNGGGTVLDKFDREQVKLYSDAFLISNTSHRTVKYFHCLAAGIPCVSHVWIRDSCVQGAVQDYIPYVLPAGVSLETGKIVEWRAIPVMPLKGRHVVVSTSVKVFVQTWSDILRSAGCFVDNELPEELDEVDVVVADSKIDDHVCYTALQADIPVVSSEWVIQCLITGKQAPYDGHRRYSYDYTDPADT